MKILTLILFLSMSASAQTIKGSIKVVQTKNPYYHLLAIVTHEGVKYAVPSHIYAEKILRFPGHEIITKGRPLRPDCEDIIHDCLHGKIYLSDLEIRFNHKTSQNEVYRGEINRPEEYNYAILDSDFGMIALPKFLDWSQYDSNYEVIIQGQISPYTQLIRVFTDIDSILTRRKR